MFCERYNRKSDEHSLLSHTMEKVKKGEIIENLNISEAGSEGSSIARHDNFVVFAEGAVPGDIADVMIFRKKKNYAEGRVVNVVKASPDRVEPFCTHFGNCGGCKWQHMSYDKQIYYKQKHVEDVLTRVGKISLPEATPIKGSANTKYYRNKLEFTFSNKAWLTKQDMESDAIVEQNALGFHVPGRFDKILDVKECFLQEDLSNKIRLSVKEFALQNNFEFFDPRSQEGYLRNLMIRSTSTGEWMVVVVFSKDEKESRELMMQHLKKSFPQITSLQYIINSKRNDTIFDLNVELYNGRSYIEEKMENLTFRISAKSFYQTNSLQAYELYKIVREYAGLTGNENVYDLYTGTGTIASFVSGNAKHVTGIDYIPDAINDASENARYNKIENVSFFAGDIKDTLTPEFIAQHGKPDVIITDPPRSGMHEDVVRAIVNAAPDRIVYVSCNPASQARDLQILDEAYYVEKYQPVDMFPHTTHVENVMLLKRKNQ